MTVIWSYWAPFCDHLKSKDFQLSNTLLTVLSTSSNASIANKSLIPHNVQMFDGRMKQKERILPSETLLLKALLSIGNTTNVFKTCHRIPLQIWLFRIMKNTRNNAWERMLGGLPANSESCKFLLVESGILSFGIRNTGVGIRNPTNNSNPESKFH